MTGGLLNPTHLIFILAVALLVIGPKRLPEVARALGSGIRDFKDSLDAPQEREPLAARPEGPGEEPHA